MLIPAANRQTDFNCEIWKREGMPVRGKRPHKMIPVHIAPINATAS